MLSMPITEITTETLSSIAKALGLQFRERDSTFMGGRYFYADGPGQEHVYALRNYFDPIDGTAEYSEVEAGLWIIRFDMTDREPAKIKEALDHALCAGTTIFMSREFR
jgi:hypothetical protein